MSESRPAGQDRKLPGATRLFYALPAAPLAALGLPLYALVPTYYTETIGLSIAAVGWVLLAVRLFDAVTDPLAGYVADRWRPAFGRRRALFALSLPLSALSALMLYWPPADAGLVYLTLWSLALSLSFTLSMVPYSAWGAELSEDYHGRTRLAATREIFTLVGTLVAIVMPFAIGFETTGFSGLAALGLTVAVSLPVLGALAIRRVPEPEDTTVSPLPLAAAMKEIAANRPFLRLLVAFFLNGLANGIPATLFLYFVSARLGLPDLRGPFLFLYFLCGIAGVPLASFVAGRIGKHRAWSLAMIAACAVFALAPLLPAGAVVGFGAVCVLTGILLGFDLVLPAAIQADVIDADTAASGDQRSGFYFAAWGLATKLSLAAGVGIVFPLLALAGFSTEPGAENSGDALFALAMLYAWLPVALKLVAIALMWNFPLGELEQTDLRSKIGTRAIKDR
ncbi:Na+/melibiose symporter [Rhizobium sp. RU20A]|uniref:MFS transporter n=1 Tax=Rhizobium sp. RU20A TaxID=1907412 RepID=UPI0009570732|nr:MFS transporter [Rhizobium sp. RU20A]SIQ12136.1 Na+/melibiose symporter [Rhizobium sp. RU20A]